MDFGGKGRGMRGAIIEVEGVEDTLDVKGLAACA